MPVPNQAQFNQARMQAAVDATTRKIDQQTLAMARASRETVSFADSTGHGRITLENFGRTFDHATKKVIVWQFAIMSVYGVIKKVGEAIQTWKDLELTLARISITTGAAGSQLQKYFQQVAGIAAEFGMPIEQTLVGMDLALRATASLGTGAKRAATSIQLLRDASVLANLTGMDYGKSMDILVGALRQTGLGLDQGIKLLDKWVAVAKSSAVSVFDLSQGFAIMADAAEAAGLSIDQMNGLIAALSEKVTLGPVEIGNAIRALMSTLYNESSINILRKYGIAVKDTNDEARNFWDIMTQLSAIRVAGVLDDSAWLSIARAAGGGARRYAQFLSLLDQMPKAMAVANVSANAQGQALDANAKIVNTLQNTWDAFTATQKSFILTMGNQTGAIRGLTGAIAGLSVFMDKLSGASPGIWQLARSITFLVATLGALKIATAAFGWLGVGPKVGGLLGRAAGIAPSAVAGTSAYSRAMMAGKYTTVEAGQAAGLGVLGSGAASRLGLLGLSGLIPGLTGRVTRNIPQLQGLNWRGGAWRGAGGRFAPTPMVGGQPFTPMTWGRMGAAITRPAGFGIGAATAGLGMGAAAYGLTKKWEAGVGSAIGAAAGMALGGPVGMLAGATIGTLVGQVAADAFASREDKLKAMFKKISEDFGVNLSDITTRVSASTALTEEQRRAAAAGAAPEYVHQRQASAGFLGALNLKFIKAPGEEEWTKGLGALNELNDALVDGVITIDEYRAAKQKDYIAWDKLSDATKDYMTASRGATESTSLEMRQWEEAAKIVREQVDAKRKLTDIDNRYAAQQTRISEIVKQYNLDQKEQAQIQALLSNQTRMTDEEFSKYYEVLVGSSYGYATHIEAIERLSPALKGLGVDLNTISEDKWLLIQRWDPDLPQKIISTTQTISTLIDEIDKFRSVRFGEILKIPGVQGTLGDLDNMKKSIEALAKTTGEDELRDKLNQALKDISEYQKNVIERQQEANKLGVFTNVVAPQYKRPGDVRLTDTETMKAYRESLSKLPQFTKLAESLREFGTSVITLVDPITGQTLRLEENSLALEMLQSAVSDNTKAVQNLEAEYNLPAWYQQPSRMWALKTTGGAGGFGPAQEGLWQTWMEYLQKNKSYAEGGEIPETGPYFLHKKERVVGEDNSIGTNTILSNSYRVLLASQGYLSSINLGILGLREEIQQLRTQLVATPSSEGTSEFNRITKADYVGVSSLGVKRR